MTLPNFIIIGAGKSGTTSLANYLGQHPDVFMSPVKEPKFFSYEGQNPKYRGPREDSLVVYTKLEDYQALFDGNRGAKAIGEASTSYVIHPGVAERMHAHIPHAKLICILRNPVDRAFSMYKHLVRDGQEPLSFQDAIAAQPERAASGWWQRWQYSTAASCSHYLEEYIDLFGREKIFFCLFEDLRDDAITLVRRIYDFLGVDSSFDPDVTGRFNKSGRPRSQFLHRWVGRPNALRRAAQRVVPRSLARKGHASLMSRNLAPIEFDPDVRALLLEGYRDEIKRLSRVIDRDLSHWLKS